MEIFLLYQHLRVSVLTNIISPPNILIFHLITGVINFVFLHPYPQSLCQSPFIMTFIVDAFTLFLYRCPTSNFQQTNLDYIPPPSYWSVQQIGDREIMLQCHFLFCQLFSSPQQWFKNEVQFPSPYIQDSFLLNSNLTL